MEAVRGRCAGNRAGYNTWRKRFVDQVLWELPGVIVQVTGLVTIPGGSWNGDQVLWNLQGVVVQVAGIIKTPGGSCVGDQVLWKMSGVVSHITPAGS